MRNLRILVLSDSHKKWGVAERIVKQNGDAKHIFFLGDYLTDIENFEYLFPDRIFYKVAGNCDYLSFEKTTDIVNVGGKKIYMTHGHLHNVKSGTSALKKAAKTAGCDIALFGHTHIPLTEYDNGLYVVNPGSCAASREGANTYAVIDILENGILPSICKAP